MLGFDDFSVFLAYILCILSAALCVVYGIVRWNKGGDVPPEVAEEERKWAAEEQKIDAELSGPGGEA